MTHVQVLGVAGTISLSPAGPGAPSSHITAFQVVPSFEYLSRTLSVQFVGAADQVIVAVSPIRYGVAGWSTCALERLPFRLKSAESAATPVVRSLSPTL